MIERKTGQLLIKLIFVKIFATRTQKNGSTMRILMQFSPDTHWMIGRALGL